MKASARYPSHLISNSHSSSLNGLSTSVASMGWIFSGMDAPFAPVTLVKLPGAGDGGGSLSFFCEVPPTRAGVFVPRVDLDLLAEGLLRSCSSSFFRVGASQSFLRLLLATRWLCHVAES